MPMMIESQFLALTNRAAVTWVKDFQQNINDAIDSFQAHLRATADTAQSVDGSSAGNLTKAAGPMGPSTGAAGASPAPMADSANPPTSAI